jgi:hypothetical protein
LKLFIEMHVINHIVVSKLKGGFKFGQYKRHSYINENKIYLCCNDFINVRFVLQGYLMKVLVEKKIRNITIEYISEN